MDDELLKLRREELKARLLRSIEQAELKRSTYTVSNDWVGDIIAKEEKERSEYIEKNYEFIEQKILSRTPTPKSDCPIPKGRFGYYPLCESLDIILYVHDKLLETHSDSVYSTFKVDGALLYLVTDDRSYHITLLFYNDDKAKLFYRDRWLSKFECHPSNCAPITTINFEKKEMGTARFYLSSVLKGIFDISPFRHIEPTFKLVKIKYKPAEDINEMNDTSNVVKLLQWYERDPHLLEIEKAAMNHAFPGFTLDKLDDGRLAWIGSLNIGILGDNVWHIMAVYNNNHPYPVMGGSVKVYVSDPDMSEIIEELEWCRSHLCRDSYGELYLSLFFATDMGREDCVTSAVSHIAMAVKWLTAFELVLTGDLSKEDFSADGII